MRRRHPAVWRAMLALLALAGLAALAAVLLAEPGHAEPARLPGLDPAHHPIIRRVTTDRAVHLPDEPGTVLVTLHNPGAAPLAATIVTTIHLNTTLVASHTQSATVRPNAEALAEVPFTIPSRQERGYRIGVEVQDGRRRVLDRASGAIDVQTGALHARFPRQCWISHWGEGVDAPSLIASQVAWFCNTVQSYASYYRPELAPDPDLATWPSLSNLPVHRDTIARVIEAAHAANMPVGFFQATGEAYADWAEQRIRPELDWGSFRNACGRTGRCTPDDLDQSPPAPGNWTQYGWQADHLDFFDPCNPGWQRFLLTRSIAPMLEQFAFDFWQADTVGKPVQPTFDADGAALDTVRCISSFTSAVGARLGRPAILNNVSGWGLRDAAQRGTQPYLYRETWDFDTPYYPGLNAIGATGPDGTRRYSTRALVQPAYINRTLAERCAIGAQKRGCTVDADAALLATAMFAIGGGTWMNHADDGCVQTNVFVEGYHLPCSAALVDRLLGYKAFEVGYQNLLREQVTDSREGCLLTSGAKGDASGAAGQVYAVGKTRPGFQICHLLNLTGVTSSAWTDLEGTKETPTPLGPVGMKLYYYGNPVDPRTDRLWWASPDDAAGAAQALPYTAGSDAGGTFVAFTLPRLSYWSMVVLETSAVGADLAIDARHPIRGSWLGSANARVQLVDDHAAVTAGGQADWPGVAFGQAPARQVSFLYTAAAAAQVSVRLDGPQGRVIATCALPAGTLRTATCPVAASAGLHDVVLDFAHPLDLYSFFFG